MSSAVPMYHCALKHIRPRLLSTLGMVSLLLLSFAAAARAQLEVSESTVSEGDFNVIEGQLASYSFTIKGTKTGTSQAEAEVKPYWYIIYGTGIDIYGNPFYVELAQGRTQTLYGPVIPPGGQGGTQPTTQTLQGTWGTKDPTLLNYYPLRPRPTRYSVHQIAIRLYGDGVTSADAPADDAAFLSPNLFTQKGKIYFYNPETPDLAMAPGAVTYNAGSYDGGDIIRMTTQWQNSGGIVLLPGETYKVHNYLTENAAIDWRPPTDPLNPGDAVKTPSDDFLLSEYVISGDRPVVSESDLTPITPDDGSIVRKVESSPVAALATWGIENTAALTPGTCYGPSLRIYQPQPDDGYLDIGEVVAVTVEVKIPENYAGTYFVAGRVDPENAVPEPANLYFIGSSPRLYMEIQDSALKLADNNSFVSNASAKITINGPTTAPVVVEAVSAISEEDGQYIQGGGETSNQSSPTADGTIVAFSSLARNLLVPPPLAEAFVAQNGRGASMTESPGFSVSGYGAIGDYLTTRQQIFYRLRDTRENFLASAQNGVGANADCFNPSTSSASGRYIAFDSRASNLGAPNTAARSLIYISDREAQSVSALLPHANGDCFNPSISANGRFVAFESSATNLDPAKPTPANNSWQQIYLHDRDSDGNGVFDETGSGKTATYLVSVNSAGKVAFGGKSLTPVVSAWEKDKSGVDYVYVAYVSYAGNLPTGPDVNGSNNEQVYRVKVNVGSTGGASTVDRVSVNDNGDIANKPKGAPNGSIEPSISGDGSQVAFSSSADNLVFNPSSGAFDGDSNHVSDVFVRNFQTPATVRVSVSNERVATGTITFTGPSLNLEAQANFSLVNIPQNNPQIGDTLTITSGGATETFVFGSGVALGPNVPDVFPDTVGVLIGQDACATRDNLVNAINASSLGILAEATRPTAVFPFGRDAVGEAVVNASGTVVGVKITNPGRGYTANRTKVLFEGGGGSGAVGQIGSVSVDPKGAIVSISLTSGGSGYTSPPKVIFSENDTATAPSIYLRALQPGTSGNGTITFSGSFPVLFDTDLMGGGTQAEDEPDFDPNFPSEDPAVQSVPAGSNEPSISEDGQVVAFRSIAYNLDVQNLKPENTIDGGPPYTDVYPQSPRAGELIRPIRFPASNIYVHNRAVDEDLPLDIPGNISTTKVSLNKFGGPTAINALQSSGVGSWTTAANQAPAVGGTGRIITFSSGAEGYGGLAFGRSNLDPLDFQNARDVYIYDSQTVGDAPPPSASRPDVDLLSPIDKLSVQVGSTISLAASAVPKLGKTIASVQFYVNGAAEGEPLTKEPYALTYSLLNPGQYTVRVVVTDSRGIKNTDVATVYAKLPPGGQTSPSVAITQPSGITDFVVGSRIELNVLASDIDGFIDSNSVYFFVDGVPIKANLSAQVPGTYAASYTVSKPGSLSIFAQASDNDGNTSISIPISVGVAQPKRTIPSIEILSLLPGTPTPSNGEIPLRAEADLAGVDPDSATVQFLANGAVVGTATRQSDGTYLLLWKTPKDRGAFEVRARVLAINAVIKTDGADEKTYYSSVLSSNFITINTSAGVAPSVELIAPSDGSTAVLNQPLTLRALAGGLPGIASIKVNTGGGGYTNVPTVTLPKPGVSAITVINGGSGYTSVPTVEIDPPLPGDTTNKATAVAILGSGPTANKVIRIDMTKVGSGYTNLPSVTISGGGGSGATAAAVLVPASAEVYMAPTNIASIALRDGGTNYTSPPTVTIAGGGGSGAKATAILEGTKVKNIILDVKGSNYTRIPVVTISGGGGSNAVAEACFSNAAVSNIVVTESGSGYSTTAPLTVSLSGGGGAGATATPSVSTPTVAAVKFYVNGVPYGEPDTTQPYESTYTPVSQGSYVFSAVAIGADGLMSEPDEAFVAISRGAAPEVRIKNPSPQSFASFTPGALIPISAEADPKTPGARIVSMQFFVDGVSLGLPDTQAPFLETFQVPGNGRFNLVAAATDSFGNVGLASLSIDATQPSADTAVFVNMTHPVPAGGTDLVNDFSSSSSLFLNSSVVLPANTNGLTITEVKFLLEGEELAGFGITNGDAVADAKSQGAFFQTDASTLNFGIKWRPNAQGSYTVNSQVTARRVSTNAGVVSTNYSTIVSPALGFGIGQQSRPLPSITLREEVIPTNVSKLSTVYLAATVNGGLTPVNRVDFYANQVFLGSVELDTTSVANNQDVQVSFPWKVGASFQGDVKIGARAVQVFDTDPDNSVVATAGSITRVAAVSGKPPLVTLQQGPIAEQNYVAGSELFVNVSAAAQSGGTLDTNSFRIYYRGDLYDRLSGVDNSFVPIGTSPVQALRVPVLSDATSDLLLAFADDQNGNRGYSSFGRIASAAPRKAFPTVSMPTNGLPGEPRYAGGFVTLQAEVQFPGSSGGEAANGEDQRVEFYANGAFVGVGSNSPTRPNLYEYSWRTPTTPGAFVINARAVELNFESGGATSQGASTKFYSSVISALPGPPINTIAGSTPTVNVTSPSNNAVLPVNVPALVTASASVTNSQIKIVRFYADGIEIGADTNAPYSTFFTPASPGPYQLYAMAESISGIVGISSPAVKVNAAVGTPPTVAITTPRTGLVTPQTMLNIGWSASDADGSVQNVQLLVNGVVTSNEIGGSAVVSFYPVSQGKYVFVARATDNLGNVTDSAPVTVTVDNTKSPVVPIVNLLPSTFSDENYVKGSQLYFNAIASAQTGTTLNSNSVRFFLDGPDAYESATASKILFGTNSVFASALYTLNDSERSVLAEASDSAGNLAYSAWYVLNASKQPRAPLPTVEILTTLPPSSVPVAGGIIPLRARASFPGMVSTNASDARVEFYADGALIGTATSVTNATVSSPFTHVLNWVAPTNSNSYKITARAIGLNFPENQGGGIFGGSNIIRWFGSTVSSGFLTLNTLTNAAPSITITTPATNGAQFPVGTTNLVVASVTTATNTAVKEVQWFVDGDATATDTNFPYSFSFAPTGTGLYNIAAVVVDKVGLQGSSPVRTVSVVSGTPPSVAIISPVATDQFFSGEKFTIRAAASGYSATVTGVEFFVNGLLIGADDDSRSPFTIDYTPPAPGTYSIFARATDSRGNVKDSLPVSINIQGIDPNDSDAQAKVLEVYQKLLSRVPTAAENQYWVNSGATKSTMILQLMRGEEYKTFQNKLLGYYYKLNVAPVNSTYVQQLGYMAIDRGVLPPPASGYLVQGNLPAPYGAVNGDAVAAKSIVDSPAFDAANPYVQGYDSQTFMFWFFSRWPYGPVGVTTDLVAAIGASQLKQGYATAFINAAIYAAGAPGTIAFDYQLKATSFLWLFTGSWQTPTEPAVSTADQLKAYIQSNLGEVVVGSSPVVAASPTDPPVVVQTSVVQQPGKGKKKGPKRKGHNGPRGGRQRR